MADYPERILRLLRQRYGYEEDDKSHDEWLQNLTPEQAFEHVVAWHVGAGWGDVLIEWARACGVKINAGGKDGENG